MTMPGCDALPGITPRYTMSPRLASSSTLSLCHYHHIRHHHRWHTWHVKPFMIKRLQNSYGVSGFVNSMVCLSHSSVNTHTPDTSNVPDETSFMIIGLRDCIFYPLKLVRKYMSLSCYFFKPFPLRFTLICLFTSLLSTNILSQSVHLCRMPSCCTLMCNFKA